jgi:Zn-dependent protease
MATSPTPFDDLPRGPYEPDPAVDPPPPPPAAWDARLKRALGPLGVLIVAALAWGAKLKLLLFALVKFKFFGTAITSVVSIGAYALLWGWRFAVLFVALLFVHELGHVVALRREGIPASAPMFIPFLGAAVFMKDMPRDAWTEAKVGLAGPVFGLLSSAAVLAAGEAYDSNLLRAAAYTGFFLNLFNLLPIVPLDGGRAAAALHPYVWIGGAVGMLALFLVFPSPLLILIALIGGMDGWRRLKAFRSGEQADYYRVSPGQRAAVAATFAALAVLLVLGMQFAHVKG